ncbi:alpha/beta fold hydrolase [Azohydromonas caseinilytica]|uniref:Alpha/beta hydrolase n=1 Tax=Azohydromonas caseinilytica TaxID=2728836 RepID=A0A848FHX0_9BURK|nr:alpha/beta hydrolase [Azohydromonas caseinilytica]NML18746.1 alpha/beta hydrolase [Azohydromonas caseinilytica]
MRPFLLLWFFAPLLLLLQACTSRTEPYKELIGQPDNESIAVLEPVDIGGMRQWVLMRGEHVLNPVLLVLHGGPGDPSMGLAHAYQRELEKHFVVVQWDQRGSGKSYADTPPDTMTLERLQADTHEMVLWLLKRFEREGIYLLGHSWGSHLGLAEARKHPENLYAYIGTGQIIDLQQQEQLSHELALDRARAQGDDRMLDALEELGPPPYADAAAGLRLKYGALWKYRLMLDDASSPWSLLPTLLRSPEYSLPDVLHYVQGLSSALERLAAGEGTRFWQLKAPAPEGFEVPVFFISGDKDPVTPLALVDEYTGRLQAPMKQSYVLKDAGHFAFFTDPEPFAEAMLDILRRTTHLEAQPGYP